MFLNSSLSFKYFLNIVLITYDFQWHELVFDFYLYLDSYRPDLIHSQIHVKFVYSLIEQVLEVTHICFRIVETSFFATNSSSIS